MSAPLNLAGALLLAALAAPLAAQTLSDPTQPPAALLAPARDGGAAPPPVAAGLQSILISRNPGGRKVAVINGRIVGVGGRVGDATVVGIEPTSVTLRRGKSVETMKLFPSTPAGMK